MTEKQPAHHYLYYGTQCTSTELTGFLRHLFTQNARNEDTGRPKVPACIWGRHGVGKTEIVQALARELGYELCVIAPAQFEEMGDLLGMPQVEKERGKPARTVYAPPAWVPREERPGILLIDDFNRADERILRGIMQLLQTSRLIAWALPKRWQIVLTANPDGGDYSVTPIDDAMLTRMTHVTLRFDVKAWAGWAEQNGVDSRGINFVLRYPELVTCGRTTPRTLVQFFSSIESIEHLSDRLGLVKMLGDGCLDDATVAAFIAFVHHRLDDLPHPEAVLGTKRFQADIVEKLEKLSGGDVRRVDILSILCTRLVHHVAQRRLSDAEMENLRSFLLMKALPKDLRLAFAQDLASLDNESVQDALKEPEVALLILK